MTEAKLAPNMPEWMVKHANLYLASGGKEGQMYKVNVPDRGEITAPALLLTTTGRKSGEQVHLPALLRNGGRQLLHRRLKGWRAGTSRMVPQYPRQPGCRGASRDQKLKARARTVGGEERSRFWTKALLFWPPYADYALKTDREIPVVVLDPVH